jgi:hypothetical protein
MDRDDADPKALTQYRQQAFPRLSRSSGATSVSSECFQERTERFRFQAQDEKL